MFVDAIGGGTQRVPGEGQVRASWRPPHPGLPRTKRYQMGHCLRGRGEGKPLTVETHARIAFWLWNDLNWSFVH